ncbi:amidase signature enzyme, partial [Bimuria novae-zelandiae CBS 107.79]
FNIFEASIAQHQEALSSGRATSVDLVVAYLIRIATYDILGGLNAFTVFNPNVFEEAAASDARRAAGLPPRLLEGIPYTIKDSYKVEGLAVTNDSPALDKLLSSEDSAIARQLREAGAVLIGKTNMPPMAAGGMQRGMYGRPESPYNRKYLPAAFSSGSSSGAAVSVTSNMAVFGMGSETVLSGRSPASNNALVAYTPSKRVLSCRGLWPLYVTCDVSVPLARSVEDMLSILDVIGTPEQEMKSDFWREQTIGKLPIPRKLDYPSLAQPESLRGKRIGVPKMYIGEQDSDPHAKPTFVGADVIDVWKKTAADLEALGADIIYTDFPLVTNYENDSKSGLTNNVEGQPSDWNLVERSTLIAKAWSEFLAQNNDPNIKSLADVDPLLLFPKPEGYLPDTWLEVRNWVHYAALPDLEAQLRDIDITKFRGLDQVLPALEAQRKRDLGDWMYDLKLDCIAFPSQGDVGLADLEFDLESARHSLQNGVKYSNGNRAIGHLGVPTVSVPMGIMEKRQMPVNLTFAGKAYEDGKLLTYAYAYEHKSKTRVPPPLAPHLATDTVPAYQR